MSARVSWCVAVLVGLLAFAAHAQDPRTQIVTRWIREEYPRELEVKTGLVSYVFSEQGGTLQSVYLYFSTLWGNPPAEVLPDVQVKPENLSRLYTVGAVFPFALTVGSITTEALYQAELVPSENPKIQKVTFTHRTDTLKVQKAFTVINEPYYTMDVELSLENLSSEALQIPEGFQFTVGVGIQDTRSEARFLFDGVRSSEIVQNYKVFDGLGFVGNSLLLWLSNDSKHQDIHPWVGTDAKGRKILGVRSEALTLQPGETKVYRFTLYAGRLNLVFLEQAGIHQVADFGLWSQALAGVTKLLNLLYAYTGNYGWALILFTLIIRLLMYPLTRAQFHSMAKMKEIQPKLEKLQARYPSLTQLRAMYPKMPEDELRRRARENREELTKKQMELFRKEGVNPMSGCLPVLLQIPIFILLWRVIVYSAEAIHLSPGFLWMSDLSQHDSLYIIVALTVLAQILQGKLTPVPNATGQSQVMTWLFPIVFGFLLKDLSAGLWLHYFVSTLVQVGQQLVVMWELRRRPQPAAQEESPAPEAAHHGSKDPSGH